MGEEVKYTDDCIARIASNQRALSEASFGATGRLFEAIRDEINGVIKKVRAEDKETEQ